MKKSNTGVIALSERQVIRFSTCYCRGPGSRVVGRGSEIGDRGSQM